jgi:hypothetical protein
MYTQILMEILLTIDSEAVHFSEFVMYCREQGLSPTDFDQLVKTKSGLMSFNNFLSTSIVREVSFTFAERNSYNPDMIGVLFQVTIEQSISSTPFANVNNASYFKS